MNELSLLVKATIVVAIGLTAAALARRTRASIRHVILASTFVALLVLPLTMALVPQVAIEVPFAAPQFPVTTSPEPMPATVGGVLPQASVPQTAEGARAWTPDWPLVVRQIWAAGAVIGLAFLGVNLWQFRRIRRHGLPWTDGTSRLTTLTSTAGARPVRLLLHEEIAAPATCGWRQATVLLPSDAPDWSDTELRHALVHELEHVRRGDWAIHLIARASCAIFWFHPLVWLAFGRLCLEAERACDDAVLQTAENADYAEQLVQLARRMSSARAQPLLAMAKRSDLATRVSAILDLSQSRGRLRASQVGGVLAAAAALMLAVAPLRAVGAAPKPAAQTADQRSNQVRSSLDVLRSSTLDRALLEAAEQNDVEPMASLVAAGANVNGAVRGDGSPLIAAARHGHVEAVRWLIDRGADPNLAVPGDGNPLIMAAQAGRVSTVQFLLEHGASIDLVAEGDENALITASAAGRLDVVKLLVARGANVNARVWAAQGWSAPGVPARDGEWRSPLSMAKRGGRTDVVKYLQSVGAQE
jgi:beta-lactamase regulating signal transducer with metallopeptidase domain